MVFALPNPLKGPAFSVPQGETAWPAEADPAPLQAAPAPEIADRFPLALLRAGLIRPADLVQVLALGTRRGGSPSAALIARGALTEDALLDAAALHFGVARVDPLSPLPDATLIDRFGLADCLRHGLLPWRRAGAAVIVVTARPEDFFRLRPLLEARLGLVLMALAPAARIDEAIRARRGPRLATLAETRVPAAESCRDWGATDRLHLAVLTGLVAGAALLLAPLWLLSAGLGLAVVSLFCAMMLKFLAILAALRRPPPPAQSPRMARLPQVSLIVALYRESDIAARLVRRLSRLDYPRDLLDVVIAVEAEDSMTRAALAGADLPPWMRLVVVPAGRIKTKPRALNLALDHCRGSIIGIYDAEDAPDPDQIRRIVDRFHRCGPDVACLQGVLDYYNPRTNWLSRCFTIEYASWFRLILPGVARLGLAVPLGGTTLFFRRAVLEELGGWDAHNVTEDADLGLRLARHGYRTELVDTVTLEEANCRPLPWIKQRSRWIKGYMMTWIVHMRDPWLLLGQLGPRAFLGFQVMFAGSILQALLAPILWSFWVLPFGLPHPLADAMPRATLVTLVTLFVLSEVLTIATGLVALRRSGHRLSPLWVVTMHLYFPLAALAAYKALWEMVARPFYWDKTSHGLFDPAEARAAPSGDRPLPAPRARLFLPAARRRACPAQDAVPDAVSADTSG